MSYVVKGDHLFMSPDWRVGVSLDRARVFPTLSGAKSSARRYAKLRERSESWRKHLPNEWKEIIEIKYVLTDNRIGI